MPTLADAAHSHLPTLTTVAKALGYCLYIAVVIELFAALCSLSGLSRSHYVPNYLTAARSMDPWDWRTEHEPWGAWHRSNASAEHVKSCFATHYRSNSVGARDRERSKQASGPRYVVLGDSFVEGWGVEESQRFTNLLEERSGREFLNFGSAGYFGPLQYQILYERLASQFQHTGVIVALLPDNDFTDNDLSLWKDSRRYRPLYGEHGEVVYLVPRPDPARAERESWLGRVPNNLWAYGFYLDWTYLLEVRKAKRRSGRPDYVGYRDPTEAQIGRVLTSIRAIKRAAEDRTLYLLLIPAMNDLLAARRGEALPLPERIRAFAAGEGIEYLDLLPAFSAHQGELDKLFLSCDGHWSAAGNALAAQVLSATWFRPSRLSDPQPTGEPNRAATPSNSSPRLTPPGQQPRARATAFTSASVLWR